MQERDGPIEHPNMDMASKIQRKQVLLGQGMGCTYQGSYLVSFGTWVGSVIRQMESEASCLLVFSFSLYYFIYFHLLGKAMRETRTDRKRFFYLLVYSSNIHNSHSWARPNPVRFFPGKWQEPRAWAIACCLPGCMLTGNWIRNSVATTWSRYSFYHVWGCQAALNHCPQPSFFKGRENCTTSTNVTLTLHEDYKLGNSGNEPTYVKENTYTEKGERWREKERGKKGESFDPVGLRTPFSSYFPPLHHMCVANHIFIVWF